MVCTGADPLINADNPEGIDFHKYGKTTPTCMGVVAKGTKCGVAGCSNDGARSLNTKKVENAGLDIASSSKKTVLCKDHYKEWKKETREDRALERARYDRF